MNYIYSFSSLALDNKLLFAIHLFHMMNDKEIQFYSNSVFVMHIQHFWFNQKLEVYKKDVEKTRLYIDSIISSNVQKMLQDEHGTASNIKVRVNDFSAIASASERLKLYTKVPTKVLVEYCGTVMTEDGKRKKMSIHFESFKHINTSLYVCNNKFHVEPLNELLESDARFGFIIMDGNCCLYDTLSGSTSIVIDIIDTSYDGENSFN
ncbi:eukaryotic peptide chain release factor subunit 1 [Reticulomyxa filosa]|uniref:Eukaryotic peptide chain release factor subunit 1 n=1 Tax=Reticulomyxa filosa TaxID=46433 RepID=X6PAW5_RETFI|nr:eukaryotic peptide chain release factor subunit 1 [Reticulomyxa filosa]|eukprot:ETO35291.1 eukaryotic peptide chain release factor subunit 1 [Reticulomyxa filosa]